MPRTTMEFVIKLSKLCNLRCSYCHEFNDLAKKERIALQDIRRMFLGIREYATAHSLKHFELIWHGGEPFLIKPSYYAAIGELQEEIFGRDLAYTNSVQTNLTVLSDELLELLGSQSFFKGIGVSFDVYGDQRVDINGRQRTDMIICNMQRLIDRNVPFGAIAVLSRHTLERIVDIYRFYDALQVECRLLPFYRSANPSQIEPHAVSGSEIVAAFKDVFDTWLGSERATPVDPLDEYIDYAINFLRSEGRTPYEMRDSEQVLIVNTNGETWGVSDTYDPVYRYGNIFREPLDNILDSHGRRRAIEEANARIAAHCTDCPYLGYCPGFFVAEATPQQRCILDQTGCPVRALIAHIVDRLQQTGLAETLMARPEADRDQASTRHRSIGPL